MMSSLTLIAPRLSTTDKGCVLCTSCIKEILSVLDRLQGWDVVVIHSMVWDQVEMPWIHDTSKGFLPPMRSSLDILHDKAELGCSWLRSTWTLNCKLPSLSESPLLFNSSTSVSSSLSCSIMTWFNALGTRRAAFRT